MRTVVCYSYEISFLYATPSNAGLHLPPQSLSYLSSVCLHHHAISTRRIGGKLILALLSPHTIVRVKQANISVLMQKPGEVGGRSHQWKHFLIDIINAVERQFRADLESLHRWECTEIVIQIWRPTLRVCVAGDKAVVTICQCWSVM